MLSRPRLPLNAVDRRDQVRSYTFGVGFVTYAPIEMFADFWFGGHVAVSGLVNVRLAASKMKGMPSDQV